MIWASANFIRLSSLTSGLRSLFSALFSACSLGPGVPALAPFTVHIELVQLGPHHTSTPPKKTCSNLFTMWPVRLLASGQLAFDQNVFLLPPANEVWGKVIFLHLFVILFTGGGGACMVAGGWGMHRIVRYSQ